MANNEIKLDADAMRHGTPPVHVHEPKQDIRLVFNNTSNTDYDVVEDDLQVSTYNETYADVFKRGLDPNIKDKQVYGVATPLKPKTALINKMREDIEKANADLQGLIDGENERIAKLEEIANNGDVPPTPPTPPTPPAPQGGDK